MSKKAVIGIGAGCLGCVGIPALLAIGGAAGWMLANQQRDAEIAVLDDAEYGGLVASEEMVDSWRSEPVRESRERDAEIDVRPVVKATPEVIAIATSTPAPVVARLSVSTPAPVAPIATPAPVALSSAASAAKATPTPVTIAVKSAPAPVAALKNVPSAPLPKATPRTFDDGEELFKKTAAKREKLASAAPATAPGATEEDVAVAALFGDEPGSALKSAATTTPAAPVADATLRKIKTKGGVVEARLNKQIVVQTTDKKTLMGTLVKVEGGNIGVRLSDGTVKTVAESQIADASEL